MPLILGLLFCVNGWALHPPPPPVYLGQDGRVEFTSDAPLELIEAASNQMRGALDSDKGTFAFTVEIATFEGFNNPLQREHFKENYLEIHRFPKATFVGKIIEKVDLSQPGTYTVRAKGKLTIHGVTQERIIKSEVVSTGDRLQIRAFFTVLLKEHDITIPKIVHQKIAEEVEVRITADLVKNGTL